MRFNHAELIERERKYPAGHRRGYSGFLDEIDSLRAKFHAEKPIKQPNVDEVIAAFNAVPPEEFTQPYALTAEGLAHVSKSVQRKYVARFKNIRRSWSLLLQHMPELMVKDQSPRDVLEMSTAHGATLEILRYFGHRVVGNDFANFLGGNGQGNGNQADSRFRGVNEVNLTQFADSHRLNPANGPIETWPYQPIIESLGLDVRLFDAGHVPYPLDDKQFDSVICMDAIEHYCHPKDWLVIIAEFCRIARQSVLVIINPIPAFLLDDQIYVQAVTSFQAAMRGYNSNGFRCVHSGVYRNFLATFKLMRT